MLIGKTVTNRTNANLIAPPSEEEAIYPYRRVWFSIGAEITLLFGITLGTILLTTFVDVPRGQWLTFDVMLALAPLGLWALFSWSRENLVRRSRQRLLPVVLLSGLVANGIGYPLLTDWLAVNSWMTRGTQTEQIIVYVFGYGILQEVLKYLVIRHTVWVDHIRTRYDALAYGAAGAVAYATVWNLHLVFEANPTPSVTAIQIFGTTTQHLVGSLIVAYGVAETRLSRTSPVLTLGMVSIASVVTALASVLKNNLTNTRLSLDVSVPRNLLDLILSVLLVMAIAFSISFLVRTADRTQAESARET